MPAPKPPGAPAPNESPRTRRARSIVLSLLAVNENRPPKPPPPPEPKPPNTEPPTESRGVVDVAADAAGVAADCAASEALHAGSPPRAGDAGPPPSPSPWSTGRRNEPNSTFAGSMGSIRPAGRPPSSLSPGPLGGVSGRRGRALAAVSAFSAAASARASSSCCCWARRSCSLARRWRSSSARSRSNWAFCRSNLSVLTSAESHSTVALVRWPPPPPPPLPRRPSLPPRSLPPRPWRPPEPPRPRSTGSPQPARRDGAASRQLPRSAPRASPRASPRGGRASRSPPRLEAARASPLPPRLEVSQPPAMPFAVPPSRSRSRSRPRPVPAPARVVVHPWERGCCSRRTSLLPATPRMPMRLAEACARSSALPLRPRCDCRSRSNAARGSLPAALPGSSHFSKLPRRPPPRRKPPSVTLQQQTKHHTQRGPRSATEPQHSQACTARPRTSETAPSVRPDASPSHAGQWPAFLRWCRCAQPWQTGAAVVAALHELRQQGEPVRVRAVHARHLQPVSPN